jgi:peptidase M50-like protein
VQPLRKFLCWTFALIAVICLRFAISPLTQILLHHAPWPRGILVDAVLALFGAVYAKAWWTSLKARKTARIWAIIASLLNILTPLVPILRTPKSIMSSLGVLLAVGVVGLIAFVRRTKPAPVATVRPIEPIAGDWTSARINRYAQAFIFALSLAAYLWWMGWRKTAGVPVGHNPWIQLASTMLLLMVITSVHEFGHAIIGLTCGMKLRAFFIGPFQWRMRDGAWKFTFNPKGLLMGDGVTGIVPGTAAMPRWQYLCMMAAGPLVNIVTGVLALVFAFSTPVHSSLQWNGLVALFGAWSLALAAGNLLPFRTGVSYSDGATILQLLSGGAMADFHLAIAAIGSSLVTPTRPRDYDIRAIQRAAGSIAQGREALLLRLHAFSHSLDRGHLREAGDALAQAERVYRESASDIPAELHSTFVFGNALVRHDANAARAWWNKMQAKNPTRMSADYFRAESALHWIEGDLEKANQAWARSNALAQGLPDAGAYEFGRHCCSLLRDVLDQTQAAAA